MNIFRFALALTFSLAASKVAFAQAISGSGDISKNTVIFSGTSSPVAIANLPTAPLTFSNKTLSSPVFLGTAKEPDASTWTSTGLTNAIINNATISGGSVSGASLVGSYPSAPWAIATGGTGANTAAGALANLGALDSSTAAATYAPLASPSFTGSMTLNGQSIVTPGACAGPSSLAGGKYHVAIDGDSYQLQNSSGYLGGAQAGVQFVSGTYSFGPIEQLNMLAGQPWWFDPVLDNAAQNGGTTTTMLASLPALLARGPSVVFLGGAHNDALNGIPLATTESNVRAAVALVQKCGAKAVLYLDPPLNSCEGACGIITIAQVRSLTLTYNNFYRYLANDLGLLTFDAFTPMVNPADATGGMYTNFTDDSIHPNMAGDYATAVFNLPLLAPIIGPPTTTGLMTAQNDNYGTTYNPYGNWLQNSLFLTTGSASAPFSGVVPTNWTTENYLSGTGKVLTLSVVTPSDNIGQWLKLAVSGVGTGGGVSQIVGLQQSVAVSAGQIFEGWVQVQLGASSPFYNWEYKIQCGANHSIGGAQMADGLSGSSAGPSTSAPVPQILYAPPVQVPVGTTTCIAYLQAQYNDALNSFSGTIMFRRPSMRLVQNAY